MALVASPQWLDTGDNAWQLAAATFVGLQSIPGLTVLYGGIVKKKWAINSAFMSMYAFASVLVVWVLFDYNMAFGPQWFPFLGRPGLATSAVFTTGQATIPAAASGMPPLAFPMATLIFFQFVFAAITVIILAGSVLGRMNFTAWMIFCPVWMTLVYTVGAFSIWGGGWLAAMGVADFSGGYVIHLAAGTSGFVAAWLVGPRLQADRDHFPPNSLLITLVGAGILWLGWDGFHGGDPPFAQPQHRDRGCAPRVDADGQDGLRQAVGPGRGQRHDRGPGGDHARRRLRRWLGRDHHRHRRGHHSVDEHELAAKDQLHDAGRRYAERLLHPRRRRHLRRPADRSPRQSGDAAIYRHRQGGAGRQRDRPLLRQRLPVRAADLRRLVHHHLQCDRDLHHPESDLVHRAAQ